MVKKFLLCASLLAGMFTTSMYAQSLGQPEMLRQTLTPVEKQAPLKHHGSAGKTMKAPAVAKSHIDLRDNEMWWGYFNGKYESSNAFDMLKMGYGAKITYACGIRLKAQNDFDMGKGKTIEGIKFVFPDLKHIEDVKIWMSTSLSEVKDMSDCDICVQNIDKADLIDALHGTPDNFTNEIRFDTPYTIGDEDVYIGYTFRVTDVEDIYDQCPVVCDETPENILSIDGAFLWRYDDEEWYEETDGEVIAMQVFFSSDNLRQNAVNIEENFQDVAMQKNTTEVLPLTLSTIGKQGLKSFKYVTTSAGKVIEEQTVTLDEPINEMGGKYVHEFQLNSGDEAGVYPTTIEITEVNGAENEGLNKTAAGDAIVVNSVPQRRVFIEDYTATWARGYAYGYANKLKLKEMYGDKLVILSIHGGKEDPMFCEDYDSYCYWNHINSYPSSYIDRTYMDVYPYFGSGSEEGFSFGYPQDVDKALDQLSVATVDVEGKLNDDNSKVDVEAKVKFEFSGEKDNFALFYVLAEDGMQDESWTQKNGLNEYQGIGLEDAEPLFEPFINGESEMTGLVYDDVAIAADGLSDGVGGSISSTISLDETQTSNHTFYLNEYSKIQDKTKLSAYAVLIDTKSGKVVNAAQCKVKGVETAISSVANDNVVEVARYTADGRQVSQPVKGINLVKYSDGSVVKRVVR